MKKTIIATLYLVIASASFAQTMLMAKVSERVQVLLGSSTLVWLDPSEKFPVLGFAQDGKVIIKNPLGPIKGAPNLKYRVFPGGQYDPNLTLKIKSQKSINSSDATTGTPKRSTFEAEFENVPAGCYVAYQVYADGKPVQTEIQEIKNNRVFLLAYLSGLASNSDISYEARYYRAGLELKTAESESPW